MGLLVTSKQGGITIEYYTTPPQIIHTPYRPHGYMNLCQRCGRNLHLRSQATKLLCFYADQKDGFTPALKLIAKKTFIPENKIYEVRQRLADRGLICYKPELAVVLNWNRITTFAALTKPITIPDAKAKETLKQHSERLKRLFQTALLEVPEEDQGKTIGTLIGQHGEGVDSLTPDQREAYDGVCRMTVREYSKWLSFDGKTGEYVKRDSSEKPKIREGIDDHWLWQASINQAVEEYENEREGLKRGYITEIIGA